MSTISVSNITTANGSEALTVTTGNTLSSKIVVLPTGGIIFSQNSSVNAIIIGANTSDNVVVTNSSGIYFAGNASISGNNHSITGNVNIDSGVLFVNGVNNRVGILNTNPDAVLTVTGTANVSGNVTFGSNLSVINYVSANVFVGSSQNPFNPIINVASVAGAMISPTLTTAASGTLTLTANRQYFVPLYVPYIFTTTNLACEVTTLGTSSSIRMNIYASDANSAPTGSPLASDVLVNSASIGVKSGAFVTTLKPGLYWASMVCNATAPVIRSLTAPGSIGISTLGSTSSYSYIYGTFTFAAMGAYSGVTSITGVAPATQTPLIAIY